MHRAMFAVILLGSLGCATPEMSVPPGSSEEDAGMLGSDGGAPGPDASTVIATIAWAPPVVAELAARHDEAWPTPTRELPARFVRLEPTTFAMGAGTTESCNRDENAPVHEVTLTHAFELSETEVTQELYRALIPEHRSGSSPGCATCPVDQVTWHEAARFTSLLSASVGLPGCYVCTGVEERARCSELASPYACAGYRLPTEAEFEYAYRAGTISSVYNGEIVECGGRDPGLARISWFLYSSDGHTHPVGQLEPNAFGLFDMSGNVWEWAADGYQDPLSAGTDVFRGATPDDTRVMRGGSYNCLPHEVRAAHRTGLWSGVRGLNVGLRLARTLPPR